MSDLAEWTDEDLETKRAALQQQISDLYNEQEAIWSEQTRRRVAMRYARWEGKKSDDLQWDYDNEAAAQGVNTKELLR